MPIDPDIMDEQLGIDRSKLSERYKRVNQPEEQQPARKIQFNMTYDQDAEPHQEFDPHDVQRQVESQQERRINPEYVEPERPNLAGPGKAAATDRELFPGGPLESEILAWKKQFGKVYSTEIEGDIYIWRPINRFEYKEIMSLPNTNELTREEAICEVCVLFPYDYSYATMVNGPGGIPSLLAEQIMQKSGFTRRVRVTAL